MMKILITGADGQVGRSLVDQLNLISNIETLACNRQDLDITNNQLVDDLVSSFRPDIIINAAAYTAVDRAENEIELAYAINRDGARYLAESANKIGAVILHISTDYVFSGEKVGFYTEEDVVNPQSIYGKSKLDGEKAIIDSCPKHIILRTAWVFGEHGNNFVKTMLHLAQTKDNLGIVGDQFGSPTYAKDIANALIVIAVNIFENSDSFDPSNYGVYNFTGSPYVSWFDFSEKIFSKATEQGVLISIPTIKSIKTEEYPTPAKRPANSRLSSDKIKATFNIDSSNWNQALNNLSDYK